MSISAPATTHGRRALVIGGSLGGLFVANLLSRIGWSVEVFERSEHDLDSRGGGIVLQPDVVEVLRRSGIDLVAKDLGVQSAYRTVFRPDGSIQSKSFSPQIQTSWALIYSELRAAFDDTHYHQGRTLERVEQDRGSGTVTAYFTDGGAEVGDLLIGADGGNSVVRRQFWPEIRPLYAGYLAWRGLVPENEMPFPAQQVLRGDFGFANNVGSHILGYLVPGDNNDVREGYRLYNWVWYRVAEASLLERIMIDRQGRQRGYSIPEGEMADQWKLHLVREAEALLPLPFRSIVEATKEPFAQAIRDLASDQMVVGRVLILGDAAAIPRPHTAASTSKAASNALALADALRSSPDDVEQALRRWEPAQIRYGKYLEKQGRQSGDYLLLKRSRSSQA